VVEIMLVVVDGSTQEEPTKITVQIPILDGITRTTMVPLTIVTTMVAAIEATSTLELITIVLVLATAGRIMDTTVVGSSTISTDNLEACLGEAKNLLP